jgi:hypothetical protein
MNRPIQPDIHPDADSLNAFAERALPDAERGRVLEHMAGCVRCRDIVYLAQQTAGVEMEPSAVAEPKTGPRRGWLSPLLTGWRIAWIPAAALAAIGGVLVWVHPRAERATINMAQVALPPAPPANTPRLPATARSVTSEPSFESAARRSETISRPAAAASQASITASPKVTRQANRSVQPELRAGVSPVPIAPAAQPGLAMSAPTQVISQPALANTQWQPQPPEPAPMTASRAMSAKIAQAPAQPNTIALPGAVMPPAADGESQIAAETLSSPQVGMPQSMDGLAVLRVTKRLKLPSGLNAVSSAGTPSRLLALDPAGAVFLSVDAGKHWDSVPPQWTGRAIEVRAQQWTVHSGNVGPVASAPAEPSLDDRSSASLPPATVAIQPATVQATPAVPPMLFRLVNDHHQTWISTDGKTWHEQPQ